MSTEEFDDIKKLVLENNKMLHSIQRRAHLAMIATAIKVLIFVSLMLGSYYYVQPYLNNIIATVEQVQGLSKTINDQKSKTDSLLKNVRDIMPR